MTKEKEKENKGVNVAKRLRDYKDILEAFEKEAADEVYHRVMYNTIINNAEREKIAYYEGMAVAYRIALTFFKQYLEDIVIKKRKGKLKHE